MAKQLQDNGYQVGRYRARSLMSKADVALKRKKRFKVTTESRHNYPMTPNLWARQFDVEAPNRVWGGGHYLFVDDAGLVVPGSGD